MNGACVLHSATPCKHDNTGTANAAQETGTTLTPCNGADIDVDEVTASERDPHAAITAAADVSDWIPLPKLGSAVSPVPPRHGTTVREAELTAKQRSTTASAAAAEATTIKALRAATTAAAASIDLRRIACKASAREDQAKSATAAAAAATTTEIGIKIVVA
ncbi:hypothetical protein [Variovorax sp. JS1663]|uniref:hypothetical protein n=1 Tax=Variovorax sp. JS1663 TaxID=1851577 RepID=UPI00130269B5|nr:hypothetical protein [Variovorax sp. JS1663]